MGLPHPSPTGYRGQRYEVRCVGDLTGRGVREMTVGWTNEADGGALVTLISAHPTWRDPVVVDLGADPRRRRPKLNSPSKGG